MDTACAPANIRYPQDISLLNEAWEKLETIIFRFYKAYGPTLPRRYARKARKDYLAYAKCRKHTGKQTKKAIGNRLSCVRRGLKYLDRFMLEGYNPVKKEISLLLADQIYRTRENRAFCKQHGIRISRPKLGWPSAKEQSKRKRNRNIRITRIGLE